jgi:hypothetical protein
MKPEIVVRLKNIQMVACTRAVVVTGTLSPSPTVSMVTVDHQQELPPGTRKYPPAKPGALCSVETHNLRTWVYTLH